MGGALPGTLGSPGALPRREARAFKSAFKTYGRFGLFAHFVGGGSSKDPGKPWGAPEARDARL